jgi:2-oxoglutarate dehydrogenase E1 component
VLGFELGYAGESPNQLVIWEAQFGDFANSAQVMIDQFIASGEAKWLRQSGITLLLPHGYDGMGPEHSSARIERFLQLVDSDPLHVPENMGADNCRQIQESNMQVVIPSTPANLFHLLRRQVHREFRKPLICISPKNLLRHPLCVSPLSEFDDVDSHVATQPWNTDVRFQRVIGEVDEKIYNAPKEVKRVLFCSGKIYFELLEERMKREATDVAIVRVEQVAPFPFDLVAKNFEHYPNAEAFWVQEEPFNAGCYGFAALHFKTALKGIIPTYIGRPASAATACGNDTIHKQEQKKVVKDAFTVPFQN